MQKLVILTIAIGSYVFAGSNNEVVVNAQDSDHSEKYAFAEDSSKDNFVPEARRRSGKGGRKGRRGGNGLR